MSAKIELLTIYEALQKLQFGQIAIQVSGGTPNGPYMPIGTAVYYDKDDKGALKFLHSGNDVIICRTNDDREETRWMIVDNYE